MVIKQPVIRCVIFVVVVGFSLLECLPVCLFVCLLFWLMLLSDQMLDMRRFNGSNECRACSIAARVLLRQVKRRS